jgi:hypothetical protein
MMNWKGFEGSGHGLILRFSLGFFLEGLIKTTKTSVRIVGLRAKV